jgi:hypothetical protein
VRALTRSVRVYFFAMADSKQMSVQGKKLMERLMVPCVCSPSASIAVRVRMIAPLLREVCAFFKSGGDIGGSEAFARLLIDRLRESGLLETKKNDVSEVGVHPDNREGMGLVTPDVHDLLLLMTENGFNRALLSSLCCSIPPNETGAAWRQFNIGYPHREIWR